MPERGLVVLGSYEPDERDIEAHAYYPWEKKVEIRELGAERRTKRIKITFYGGNRVSTSIRDFNRALRQMLPKGFTADEWWRWANENNLKATWKGHELTIQKTGTGYRAFWSTSLTKEYNLRDKLRERREEDKELRKELELPIPVNIKNIVQRGPKKAINAAERVLVNWLNEQGYMIPPFEKESGFKTEDGEGHPSIGAQVKGGLESEVRTNLPQNEFALVIFDYDFGRVPKRSYFAFDTDWFTDEKGIRKVMQLANRNTGEYSGFEEKTSRTTSASLGEFE